MGEYNILEEKTKEKFGYDVSDLKPNSEKLVVWFCSDCKTEFDKKHRYAKKNKFCLNCSNKRNAVNGAEKRSESLKEWHKLNEHPLQGTQRPQHVKDALIKSHIGIPLSDETKEKLSKAFSGKNNPFFGKKHTKESLEKMIEFQRTNTAIRGINSNFYGKKPFPSKGSWYTCKDGSKVWMRSSWEIKYAEFLDENKIEWLYEPKTFPVFYNNKEGTYTPDFLLLKENKFIEIKGWWRGDAQIKYDAFVEEYKNIKIEVYERKKLKEIGVKIK
jgi:hypothetical protein